MFSLIFGAILGVVGAGIGIFSGARRAREEQAEIAAKQEAERKMREARIKELKASAERDIAYAKSQFNIEKQNALTKAGDIFKQGERIDYRAGIDETLTGRAFNLAMKRDNLQDKNALKQEQRGKQNFERQQGGLKASLGMSGVRNGSSTSEQLLTQNENEFNQDLALMKEQREVERDINLMSAWNNLRGGMLRIDDTRDAANKAFRDSKRLKDDYSENGRVVNLFNQKIQNRREDLEGNVNLMNIGGNIQQEAMSRAYDRAEYSFTDGLSDFFTGASAGWNLGSSIGGFGSKWASPTMDKKVSMVRNPYGNYFG